MFDHQLFETAPDAMIVVDRNGRIVRANAQAERLFGYGEKELLGAPIETLMPEQARRAHEAHLAGYAANPRVRPMGAGQELTGQKRGGQQFPVEIALSPVDSPQGRMFVASVRDISETHRARQALVRARYDAAVAQIGQLALAAPNLDAAIASMPELVALALRVDGVAIVFRHAQLNRMQVRAAHGVDNDVLDALPWPALLAQHAANPPFDIPGFNSHALEPLNDLGEAAGALLVLNRESREFDRDAMYFMQSIANLLAAAMQRMRMEEQLSHAQRLEAVGQLTGGIAHDFNNLLTVISGNLQILEDELADRPSAHAVISSAQRAVDRGADLTRKLLAFARRQRLAPRACDPAKLLEELGVMLRRTLGMVELTITCAPGIAPVFADPSQLDTALINLALNARDAMPRGGQLAISAQERHVDAVEASEDLRSGRYVVFTVRDTGLGMAPDVLARAFEPFFTTKEHGKGSGLGLSMVYGFVKQSGGHLSVESQLGYGTRIDLYLPVAQATNEREGDVRAQMAARGNESVLVVEDEADVRGIAVAFLRSLGYTVLAAADAQDALTQLAAHAEIALLFSDIGLGAGMNGIELATEARRRRPQLRVLLTSGHEQSGANDPADQFALLPKPYRREELSAAVRGILDR